MRLCSEFFEEVRQNINMFRDRVELVPQGPALVSSLLEISHHVSVSLERGLSPFSQHDVLPGPFLMAPISARLIFWRWLVFFERWEELLRLLLLFFRGWRRPYFLDEPIVGRRLLILRFRGILRIPICHVKAHAVFSRVGALSLREIVSPVFLGQVYEAIILVARGPRHFAVIGRVGPFPRFSDLAGSGGLCLFPRLTFSCEMSRLATIVAVPVSLFLRACRHFPSLPVLLYGGSGYPIHFVGVSLSVP